MTAGIAHEIKNPLNFINNFAALSKDLSEELLSELEAIKPAVSEDQFRQLLESTNTLQANLTKINSHGKRTDQIIRSMMEHADNKKGKLQRVNINNLVSVKLELAHYSYRATHASFKIDIGKELDPKLPLMEVFPQSLGRALFNIIVNAFDALAYKKATDKGSFQPRLNITTRSEADGISILIQDNGPGIPADIRDKIFSPFFTTKDTGSGNIGLGLSITYDIIVKEHYGALEVVSEEGESTTFLIKLSPQS